MEARTTNGGMSATAKSAQGKNWVGKEWMDGWMDVWMHTKSLLPRREIVAKEQGK